MGDITKFLNNTTSKPNGVKEISVAAKIGSNIKTMNNINKGQGMKTKSNSSNTVVVTQKTSDINKNNFNVNKNIIQTVNKNNNTILWPANGHVLKNSNNTNSLNSVVETVRNFWANKELPNNNNNATINKVSNKRSSIGKTDSSPPLKIKKIDNYFNQSPKPISNEIATSLLKDIYGEDFAVYKKDINSKIIAVQNPNADLVNCPICNIKVKNTDINMHLDECLNRDVIEELCSSSNDVKNLLNIELEKEIFVDKSFVKTETDIGQPSTSKVKVEHDELLKPSTSKDVIKTEYTDPYTNPTYTEKNDQKCPCCSESIHNVSMEIHLDDCLSFMNDITTVPDEGAAEKTDVISLIDDEFDESQIFNETGTKYPCPCCLVLIEQDEMNSHLDECLK